MNIICLHKFVSIITGVKQASGTVMQITVILFKTKKYMKFYEIRLIDNYFMKWLKTSA